MIQAVAKLAEPPTSDPKTAAIALTIAASIASSDNDWVIPQFHFGGDSSNQSLSGDCQRFEQVEIAVFSLGLLCNVCYNWIVTPEQVRKLRERFGLTQEEFAAQIGSNRVTVARWETGKNEPRGLYLRALEDLAGKARKKKGRR